MPLLILLFIYFLLLIEYYTNKNNCFEQLCINFINERFHQLFVRKMVKEEQDWYKKENLEFIPIPFIDNIRIVGKLNIINGIKIYYIHFLALSMIIY